MEVARSTSELRAALEQSRSTGTTVGFVPTMGALHAGHLSLVEAARARCDIVMLSIFVNPLQFGAGEDLASYPRAEHRDLGLAQAAGVDVVFVPPIHEIYPDGAAPTVSAGPLGDILEGADRPGHFDGVATVVQRLFELVEPDLAFFGQKDAQQLAVVKHLVRSMPSDIEIVTCPTVRAPDGLALSSRNAYLTVEERERATALYRALVLGIVVRSEEGDEAAEKGMWDLLVSEGLRPSYARVVDPDTFTAARPAGPALLVAAAHLGTTRLIDNMLADPEG